MTVEDVTTFIEHYGVKGMRWGKRGAGKVARLDRVAEGKGSASDKIRTAASVSTTDLAKGRGLKGAAARKSERLQKPKKTPSNARTRYAKAPSKLSTKELQNRISRMETEKKYNQLNRQDVSEGRKFANEVLTGAGRRVATTVLTGASLVAIRAALDSKLGSGVGSEVTRRLK